MYQNLLDYYGPQGWWPLMSFAGTNPTLRGRLTGYHPGNFDLPETDSEVLEIMLGTILTQNASWLNAEKALFVLAEHDLVDVEKLLNTEASKLAELIRPARFNNQKAARIHILMQYLLENPIKSLQQRSVEDLRPELRSIKGVGNETCDSILLYALKKPIFVVDAYTSRLLIRCGMITPGAKYEEIQALFQSKMPTSVEIYNEFHALIVQHCVHGCLKEPICEECPLDSSCPKNPLPPPKPAKAKITTRADPAKKSKKAIRKKK
jgi:endonuclease-3 related protein